MICNNFKTSYLHFCKLYILICFAHDLSMTFKKLSFRKTKNPSKSQLRGLKWPKSLPLPYYNQKQNQK